MGLKYLYAKEYTANADGTLGTPTGNVMRMFLPSYPQYTMSDMRTIIGNNSIVWGKRSLGVISDAGLAFLNTYPDLFMGTCAMVDGFANANVQQLYGPMTRMYATSDTLVYNASRYYILFNETEKTLIQIGPGTPYNGDLRMAECNPDVGTFTPTVFTPFLMGSGGLLSGYVAYRTLVECSDGFLVFRVGMSNTYTDDISLGYNNFYSSTTLITKFYGMAQPVVIDPYAGGGTSGPGGGDGTFDFTSTDVPIPPLPGIGAYNTGFLTLYKPTAGELQSTAQYMWSGSFDPDNFRKLFANPMDAILGLHIVPTSGVHPAAGASTLQIGNISTGLSMARVTEQYYELDCGTITISPKWGAYLDYSPYSKLSLYLPYVGIVPISPDDCMGGSIRVVYHVDILSGSCCVYVYCTSNRGADGHTLYTFTGACACDCPVTEGQYTNAVLGILGIAGGVAGAISAGLSGNAGGITGGIGEAANAALSMVKPDIGRSGNFGGSAGLMGIQYPYLILTIPKMCTPGQQNIYRGYPSFVTVSLADMEGYAEVEITHISGMSATTEEVEELRSILESGVIF